MAAPQNIKNKSIPKHIAIIMDGNGRWAQKRGLERHIGHSQGSKTAENIIRYCAELGVKKVTLYAFSSENWQRPKNEVLALMSLLEEYLTRETKELVEKGVKISTIGEIEKLPLSLQKALEVIIQKTDEGNKMELVLALSYGSWAEVTIAVKNIAEEVLKGNILAAQINEQTIQKHLFTKMSDPPDLFIRTGGELRLSNFMLLQLSYSELYFSKKLWPDFSRADLKKALANFSSRVRRFGKISD